MLLFYFLETKFQNGAYLEKRTYFSHFFSHQGKDTKIPSAYIIHNVIGNELPEYVEYVIVSKYCKKFSKN